MFSTIFILLIDFCAFFFIGYSIFNLNKKVPGSFLWNKPLKNIKQKSIKQYNRAISLLYIIAGLSFFIVGLIANYLNLRLSALFFIIVVAAVIPTLSTIQILFINSKYQK